MSLQEDKGRRPRRPVQSPLGLPVLCLCTGPSLSLDVLEPAPSGLSSAFPRNPAWVHVIPSGPLWVLLCGCDGRPEPCSCPVPALPRWDRSRAGERPPQRTRSHGAAGLQDGRPPWEQVTEPRGDEGLRERALLWPPEVTRQHPGRGRAETPATSPEPLGLSRRVRGALIAQ